MADPIRHRRGAHRLREHMLIENDHAVRRLREMARNPKRLMQGMQSV
jgi:hypothetical protein